MRASNKKMFEGLLRAGSRFGAGGLLRERPDEELPLRSELFSADQMEQHGKTLAASHKLSTGRAALSFLPAWPKMRWCWLAPATC